MVRRRVRDNALAGVHVLWVPSGLQLEEADPLDPCLGGGEFYENDAVWPLVLFMLLMLVLVALAIAIGVQNRRQAVVWAPHQSMVSARSSL